MGQGTVIERDVREIHFSMFFFLLMVNCSCCNYMVYVFLFFFFESFPWVLEVFGMRSHGIFCLDVTLQGELMLETMARSWWAGHGSLICTKRLGRHKCRNFFSIEWLHIWYRPISKQNSSCCHFVLEATLLGLPIIWKKKPGGLIFWIQAEALREEVQTFVSREHFRVEELEEHGSGVTAPSAFPQKKRLRLTALSSTLDTIWINYISAIRF